MKDSLQNLLRKFPHLFDKRTTSNFYKSQSVTNAQFQNIYQSLFEVVESVRISKNCLIWKEQSASYEYTIHFVANFPCLKSVILYKNEEIIYSDEFNYEDNVDNFNYSYTNSTLNEISEGDIADIIPQHQFKIIVETFEEYKIVKGFPENDFYAGDEYDHDSSLDEIGALHNIPRKKYNIVDADQYITTEPPFNDRASEDDYHYMRRLLEYIIRYHTTPLPLLELWKLYGIESRMENRERLLLKVFDVEKRGGTDWSPQPWEHKDTFCNYSQLSGTYFFIRYSTNLPTRKQNVHLEFLLVNGIGENVGDDTYLFDIYVGDELVMGNYNLWYFTIVPEMLSQINETTVCVVCKDSNQTIIGSAEVDMRIRGCQDASIFVSPEGSDSNNGRTPETALKTIQKACEKVIGNDLIAILGGNYTINSPILVSNSCTIMCCDTVVLENTQSNKFFNVAVGKELSLQDFILKYDANSYNISDASYINKNSKGYVTVIAGLDSDVIYIITGDRLVKNLTFDNKVLSYDLARINETSDYNGVIYDLEYADGKIKYKVFSTENSTLTAAERYALRTAIISMSYENKTIKYTELGDIL